MASIDVQEPAGPRSDTLGLTLFVFHLGVGLYILTGWAIPSVYALTFYLTLIPAVVLQWLFNRGSCVINNFESWLRTGRWRHPGNPEEGRWLQMLIYWAIGVRPSGRHTDALCYGVMAVLWLLGLSQFVFYGSSELLAVPAVS
jgi:hypothetical protein